MDHATRSLKAIKESGKYAKLPNVVIFDAHEEFDENGNLVRRFGREELQELCDVTNKRAEGGDPTILGLGHTIPRDPITRMPVPEDKQPIQVGYAMDLRVGQFGPEQKTGILVDYYIEKDKLAEWKTYTRGRSIELWPKKKVIDWVASLRKAPQRDLGHLDLELLTFSRDALEAFTPTRKYYGDAANTRLLAMAQRGEKLFYSMDNGVDNANVDSDGQDEDTMDPTKPPDAMAPEDDFCQKIDRYMAEKYPVLARMCQEATQKYAMESNPNAVGAPVGATLDPKMDAPGGDQGIDAAGGDAPEDDDDSTGDEDDGDTGPGFPGAKNTSVPGSKKKKKKGNPMAEDKKDDAVRMEKDAEAIRYARLEEEVKQLREARVADQNAAKKAKATQRIQSLQFQGFTLDPVREVERYCALDETTWDKEDEHIKQYYKQDSVGMVPMGGTIPTAGMPQGQPAATKGRMSQDQMRKAVSLTSSKGMKFEDAAAQVLAGQV
jgi:hypothetical protein